MAMRPNFLVIGAAKAATTSLCHLLGQHPDVFMSDPKEPRFFSHDSVYQRGWRWYESLFADAEGCTAVGEGSPSYSVAGVFPNTVSRIIKHLPEVRIVYIVRHPLERIESAWMQARHSAKPGTLRSFDRFLRERPRSVEANLYFKQINAYRKDVPDERILVLFFEDFVADVHDVLAKCFRFLQVDPGVTIPEAEAARNPSATHTYDGWLMSRMRRMPMFDAACRLVPRPLGPVLQRVFRKRFRGRPQWTNETRRWYIDQIADNICSFLEFYGKPADFWDLNQTPIPGVQFTGEYPGGYRRGKRHE